MALPTVLFGRDYHRHRVTYLEYFLECTSRPFRLHSSKRILFSNLVGFERSLAAADQATLRTLTERFYETRNTANAAVARRDLQRSLKSISQEEGRSNEEPADGRESAKSSPAPMPNDVVSRKRKRYEISKGTRRKGKKAPANKSRNCSVCYEEVLVEHFPDANITSKCKHANNVCTFCVGSHIDARIEIGQFGFINCPVCPETLGLEDVRRLCKSDTFERYDRLVTRTAVEKDPNFHFCLHGCGSGQYVSDKSNKMKCGQCENTTCIRHAIPWHDGVTCEEYDKKYGYDSDNNSNESPVQPKSAKEPVVSERKKIGVERAKREQSRRNIWNSQKEKTQKEKTQKEKTQEEKARTAKAGREKALREKALVETAENERFEREKARRAKALREKAPKEKFLKEKAERERADRERAERERTEREKADQEKAIKDAEALRRKRAKDDKASQETLGRTSRACPNKDCGAPIEKNGGCDYMQCTRCKQEFCWHCMRVWIGDHGQFCAYRRHWGY